MSKSTTYEHIYVIAFTVKGSESPDGEDVTPQQLRAAVLARVNDLGERDEWLEAVGDPIDTEEREEE